MRKLSELYELVLARIEGQALHICNAIGMIKEFSTDEYFKLFYDFQSNMPHVDGLHQEFINEVWLDPECEGNSWWIDPTDKTGREVRIKFLEKLIKQHKENESKESLS